MLPAFATLPSSSVDLSAIAISSYSNSSTEIIGTTADTMTNDIYSNYSVSSQAPFDIETKTMMDGLSFVPYYNSNYEVVSRAYQVNDFVVSSVDEESIFMWIYFPDNPWNIYYDLYIKFYNSNGDYVSWEFDYDELSALFRAYDPYNILYIGWKLIEFSLSDADTSLSSESVTLSLMNISYKLNENFTDYQYYNATDALTIYSVYLSESTSSDTIVSQALNYYYYGFDSSFSSSLVGLYVGGSRTLPSISSVFSYVYVGKSNLSLAGTQNNNFAWDITFSDGNDTYSVTLPATVYFDTATSHTLTFTLTEYRSSSSTGTTVFTAKYVISVYSFVFGKFSSQTYEIKKGDSAILQFSLTDNFVQISSVTFSVEDEKALEIVSIDYDSSLGIYYIEVKALKKGSSNIVATSTGYRSGSSVTDEVSYQAVSQVTVKYNGISEWMKIVLLAFLGLYLAAFVIFVVISFVNVRRNIVK